MEQKSIKLLPAESYLAFIKNSIGSNCFRNLFALVDGEKKDILRDGELSCAYFVSAVLTIFKIIDRPHTTVAGLVKTLSESTSWRKISLGDKLISGDVIVWEKLLDENNEWHEHVGFYVGNDQAVSNSSEDKTPILHHFTYGEEKGGSKRKLVAVFHYHN